MTKKTVAPTHSARAQKKKNAPKRTSLRRRMGCSVYVAVFFFFVAAVSIGLTLAREYFPTIVVGYLVPSLQSAFPDCNIDVSVKSANIFRTNVSCSVYSEDSDGGIKGDLNSITIDYTPWSLMRGKISSVIFENMNIVIADKSQINTKIISERVNHFLSVLSNPPIEINHIKVDGILIISEGEYGIIPIRNTYEIFAVKSDGERVYRISFAASSSGKSSVKFDGEYRPVANVLDGVSSFYLASDTATPYIKNHYPAITDVPFSVSGSGKIVFSASERKLMKDTSVNGTFTPEKRTVSCGIFPNSPFSFKFGSDDGKSTFLEVRHLKTSVCGFDPEIASLTLKQTGNSAKGSAVVVVGPGMQFDADADVKSDEKGDYFVSLKSISSASGQVDNGEIRISGGKTEFGADFSFLHDGKILGSFSCAANDAKIECLNRTFSCASINVSGKYGDNILSSDVSASDVSMKTKKYDFVAGRFSLSSNVSSDGACSGKLSFDDGCAVFRLSDGDVVVDGVSAKQAFSWKPSDGFNQSASKGTYNAKSFTFNDNKFANSQGETLLSDGKLSLAGQGLVCGKKYNVVSEFSTDGDCFAEITVPRQKLEPSADGSGNLVLLRGMEDLNLTKGEVKGHVRLVFADGKIKPVMLIVFSDLAFDVPSAGISGSGGNVVLTDAGRNVSFSSVRCGSLEFGRTNITIAYDDDDDVAFVENANMSFCGGTIKLMPGKFDRRSGKFLAEVVCRDLNAEDLAKMFLPDSSFNGNLAFSGTISAVSNGHDLSILPGSRLNSVNEKYVETRFSSEKSKTFKIGGARSRGTESFGIEIPAAMAQNSLKHFNCSWSSVKLSGDTEKGIAVNLVSCGRPIDATGYVFSPEDSAFIASKNASSNDEIVIRSESVMRSSDLEKLISWLLNRFVTRR